MTTSRTRISHRIIIAWAVLIHLSALLGYWTFYKGWNDKSYLSRLAENLGFHNHDVILATPVVMVGLPILLSLPAHALKRRKKILLRSGFEAALFNFITCVIVIGGVNLIGTVLDVPAEGGFGSALVVLVFIGPFVVAAVSTHAIMVLAAALRTLSGYRRFYWFPFRRLLKRT